MTEPKTISELMKLVMEECKKGNINNAIIYLNEAIEIEPNKAYLYNYRAESKRKLGDNEGADEDDRKAVKLKNIF